MAKVRNPYEFGPAIGNYFVGRSELLNHWQARLTSGSVAWKNGKNWLIVAPAGMGKTSLLIKMRDYAKDAHRAWVMFIDIGFYRELDSLEDFFEHVERELPPASRLGTRMRHWFDLEPDSSLAALSGKVALTLLQSLSPSIAPAPWQSVGLGVTFPGQSVKESQSITTRVAQIFNRLAVLSEEQTRPVIVFIDQIGKVHDSVRWQLIAQMWLNLIEHIHATGDKHIIFVVSLRPEEKGKLEYDLQGNLFQESLFENTYLHPLTEAEAVEAITVRGGPYIIQPIAQKIVDAVKHSNGVDPYAVQLGAMAVWNYVLQNSHAKTHIPISDIVRQGHTRIVTAIDKGSTEWHTLITIAFEPSGLTVSQISQRIKIKVDQPDIETAVDHLMNATGYRLLNRIDTVNTEARYAITHDLLRDYILEQLPEEQRQAEQAQRTLDNALWRYSVHTEYMTESELKFVWKYRAELQISTQSWSIIVGSGLRTSTTQFLSDWSKFSPKQVLTALEKLHFEQHNMIWRRAYLIRTMLIDALEKLIDALHPILNELAHHNEPEIVRWRAAETLAQLRSITESLPVLYELASSSVNKEIRRQVVEILGQLGEPALPVLRELAYSADDEEIRSQVVEMIGQLGDLALPVLREFAHSADHELGRQAAETLGQLGEPALSILIELAKGTANEWARLQAAEELGKIGAVTEAIPVLRELVYSIDEWLRWQVAKELGKLGAVTEAIPVLSNLARGADNEQTSWQAVQALGELGMPALPTLKELARSVNDEQIRWRAAQAIGRLGETGEALPVLSELARSANNKEACRQAAEALGEFRKPAMEVLSELARSATDQQVRGQAVRALGQYGVPVLELLSELAHSDENSWVRRQAAQTLGDLGEPALPVLCELAHSASDEWVRRQAAQELVQLGLVSEALPILSDLARSNDNKWVRRHATQVLRMLGQSAHPVLIELTHSTDEQVCWYAAKALGELGAISEALPVLRELACKADDEDIRVQAIEAMGWLGSVLEALPMLNELACNTSDNKVRIQATKALRELAAVIEGHPMLNEFAFYADNEQERRQIIKMLERVGSLDIVTSGLLELLWANPYSPLLITYFRLQLAKLKMSV